MKLETVYDKDGNVLGSEYVNLIGLQLSTTRAINQIFYLEETVKIYREAAAKISQREQAG